MVDSQGLTHIHLAVRDLQRSLKFYQAAFGMQVRYWDGPAMVFLNTPGSSDTVTLRQAEEGDPVGPGGGVAYFGFRLRQKEDLESAIQHLVKAGGSLIERGEHQSGTAFAYVSDPDGYIIEL